MVLIPGSSWMHNGLRRALKPWEIPSILQVLPWPTIMSYLMVPRNEKIRALIRNGNGQVNYLFNTVVTNVRNREKNKKDDNPLCALSRIYQGRLDEATDNYKKVKMLKEIMTLYPTTKMNFMLHEC